MRRGFAAAICLTVLAGAAIVVVSGTRNDRDTAIATAGNPGTEQPFAYLAEQRSNRCDLTAAEVGAMPDSDRLQGSCCQAMDETRYREQVAGLRQYGGEPLIPGDPYDVSVAQVKRLLAANDRIKLSAGERVTYRRAMDRSATGGPCCCRCWRWSAFRGLSKYLIARREWSAPELAALIGDLDGCGGSAA
jgi:hypothetical protein